MRRKYGNTKVHYDGMTFDSKKEYTRWLILEDMVRKGEISQLRRQVRFNLLVNGTKVCAYVADAVYTRDRRTVVEDTKGMRTQVYKIKKKLMLACLGMTIEEI